MEKISDELIEIANKIARNGGRLYLVGGAVRDMQLGKEANDMDFCVTGISAEKFSSLFNAPRVQGKSFPVFILHGYEFALARKERKIGSKHTDFEIISDESITIEEDLSRRDLTINSIAMDVLTKEIIDPFHGVQDLNQKVLRMTTKAFCEDALRVYRIARFAAKLGFKIEAETLKTMENMKDELANLSAERVCTEFRKALNTERPGLFFETLRKVNVLEIHFKELSDLIGVEQPLKYHPEGDAYTHTLEVLERTTRATSNIKDNELIRFCSLVHDFGKGITPKDEWPHHYNHEKNGVLPIKQFCKRLKLPKKYEKAGILTSLLHMKAGIYDTLKPSTKIKLFMDIEASRSLSYEGLEIIASCDSKRIIKFANIARQVMKLGVTTEIKEKCTDSEGIFDYEKAKQMVMQLRIEELKKLQK